MHVIIIGGGTGGMCLAHGLRAAGISVAVYERYRTRTDGLFGYRIGISSHGSRALAACLPPDLYRSFLATCALPPIHVTYVSEQLDELLALDLPINPSSPVGEKSVSRMALRQLLFTGIEEVVHFDREFTHFAERPDGKVEAFFADGSTAIGDLLVGADGTHSNVRKQYLPAAEIVKAGVVALSGKVPLTDDARALLPRRLADGSAMIFGPQGVFSIMHAMNFPWGARIDRTEHAASTDAEATRRLPDLVFDSDHWAWGLSHAKRFLPNDATELKGRAIIDLARRITEGWHPKLHQLYEMSDPASCIAIDIATSRPVPPWRATRVTLLGDAIHTMTPGRGAGANTALRDADLLRQKLIDVRDGRCELLEAVGQYEREMRSYAYAAVAESLQNMGGDNPLYRPVLGPVLRTVIRTGMRVANSIPFVRRRLAAQLLVERGADPSTVGA